MSINLQTAAVMPLTHENFDEVVDGSKNVFVKFYAPVRDTCVFLSLVVWSLPGTRTRVRDCWRFLLKYVEMI